MKPTLTLDFDGVIHGYQSGWKGARNIPDPPVPGALRFIVDALEVFEVNILSSRSHQFLGRRAMKNWLIKSYMELGLRVFEDIPDWWLKHIAPNGSMDPWVDECRWAAERVVKQIKWPVHKPGSLVSIDDRGLTFTGEWPEPKALLGFKPWNKK